MPKHNRNANVKAQRQQRQPLSRRQAIRRFLIVILPLFILAFPFSLMNAHLVSGSISYQTAWDLGQIVRSADNQSWSVVNDLGYTVNVTRGYIVSSHATLNECGHVTGVTDWLASLFSTSVAHAGHTSGGPDQAAIAASYVESLTALEPLQMGSVAVSEYSYCKGHYLIAQATPGTHNQPADVTMQGHSLYVEGTYQAPGSTAQIPFTIKTSLGNGNLYDLKITGSDQLVHAVISSAQVQITIRRHIDTMFNGVDFTRMDDETRTSMVLDALIVNTEMLMTGGKWH
jgi:hypothetical protein